MEKQLNPAIFWLIGALVLFFLVILLVLFLLRRSRGIGKDLEELVKERTSALAFETSKLQAVIDSVPDILFCKDTNYKYTQCNAPFEQFLGVRESEIVGKSDKDGAWFHPDDMKMVHDKEKIVMTENRVLVFEERIHSPITGQEKVLETVKAPIRQNGETVGMLCVARDITMRKAMEDEIRAALESKTSFLAHMSHELRTPLNVVIGLTDLILEDARLTFMLRIT